MTDQTANVNVRVEENVKTEAENILSAMRIPLEETFDQLVNVLTAEEIQIVEYTVCE